MGQDYFKSTNLPLESNPPLESLESNLPLESLENKPLESINISTRSMVIVIGIQDQLTSLPQTDERVVVV